MWGEAGPAIDRHKVFLGWTKACPSAFCQTLKVSTATGVPVKRILKGKDFFGESTVFISVGATRLFKIVNMPPRHNWQSIYVDSNRLVSQIVELTKIQRVPAPNDKCSVATFLRSITKQRFEVA